MKLTIFVLALTLLLATVLGRRGPFDSYDAKDDDSAGRHRLQERVGDFLDNGQVAGRYHQRTRTAKFFGRGAC